LSAKAGGGIDGTTTTTTSTVGIGNVLLDPVIMDMIHRESADVLSETMFGYLQTKTSKRNLLKRSMASATTTSTTQPQGGTATSKKSKLLLAKPQQDDNTATSTEEEEKQNKEMRMELAVRTGLEATWPGVEETLSPTYRL